MGDLIGVHGPHAKHLEEVLRSIIEEEGTDLSLINKEHLASFARLVSTHSRQQIDAQEFQELCEEYPQIKKFWDAIRLVPAP